MTKKLKITVGVIGLVLVLGFAGVWLTYYFSAIKANKQGLETACKENIEQEFVGQVFSIDRYEYSDFMHNRYFNIKIRISDTINSYIDYHYNLKPNKELLDFVKTGQKAIKYKDENTFTLIDSTGIEKIFKIAKCADYE
jgi:hypothetical protein